MYDYQTILECLHKINEDHIEDRQGKLRFIFDNLNSKELSKTIDGLINKYGNVEHAIEELFDKIVKTTDGYRIREEEKIEEGKKVFDKESGYNISKDELYIFDKLKKVYPNIQMSVTDDRMINPDTKRHFQLDFYDPDTDTGFNYNKHIRHGRSKFNPENPIHQQDVEWLKQQDGEFYEKILFTWTILDPLKRELAKQNGLKLIEWFNLDEFNNWLQNPSADYEEYKYAPDSLQYNSDEYFKQKARGRDIYGVDSDPLADSVNESAKEDLMYLQLAEVVYEDLVKKIQKEYKGKDTTQNRYLQVSTKIPNLQNPLLFTIVLDERSNSPTIRAEYADDNIVLYLPAILAPMTNKKIDKSLFTYENIGKILSLPQTLDVFVHEFQHYLFNRVVGKNKNLKYGQQKPNEDYNAYRTSPNENNSFFFQDLRSVVEFFNKYMSNRKQKPTESMIKQFIGKIQENDKILDKISQSKYYQDPKQKARFLNRLYRVLHYMYVEKDWSEVEKMANRIKQDYNTQQNAQKRSF